jgi:hypothetical protein
MLVKGNDVEAAPLLLGASDGWEVEAAAVPFMTLASPWKALKLRSEDSTELMLKRRRDEYVDLKHPKSKYSREDHSGPAVGAREFLTALFGRVRSCTASTE